MSRGLFNTMNKLGMSTGFSWIFGLLMIFGLGIIYIVFSQVLSYHIAPTTSNLINNSNLVNETVKAEVQAGNDKFMKAWTSVPFIIIFVVVLFMVLRSISKDNQQVY